MRRGPIIISGATGFVGRRLVKEIIKLYPKNDILCLVRDSDNELEISGRKILKGTGLKTKKVDLVSGKGLDNLPHNPKLVLHLSAETDTSKKDHRVNDLGTKNLYGALGKLDGRTHFVYIGTMVSVIGRKDTQVPINESTRSHPNNEYTRTKVGGEGYLIQKCKKDKFKLTILTPNTIYGKNVRLNSLFDMVIKMVQKGSLVTRINWPGKSALIHVDDVVDCVLRVVKKPPRNAGHKKYLIYSENLSISDISKVVHKALGIKYSQIQLPESVWKFFKSTRRFLYFLEKFTPTSLYNFVWRFSIIIDDSIKCETKLFEKNFKKKKFIKLKDAIGEVLEAYT